MTSFSSGRDEFHTNEANDDTREPHEADVQTQLSTVQGFSRWADLVARGEVAFPTGLTEGQEESLLQAVRQRRRQRLVQVIARAVAQDIRRSRGQ